MLSKYFSKALAEAGIDLPEVEVRDLTFLADPKSCGWIEKEDFLKITVSSRSKNAPTREKASPADPTNNSLRFFFPACFSHEELGPRAAGGRSQDPRPPCVRGALRGGKVSELG